MANKCIEAYSPALNNKHSELVKSGLSDKAATIQITIDEYNSFIDELNSLENALGMVLTQKSFPEEIASILEEDQKTIVEDTLESRKEREIREAEEKWRNNVDERGFPKESFQPILEAINKKYTPVLEPQVSKRDINLSRDIKNDPYKSAFRKATTSEILQERIDDVEINLFKEWAEKNVPNIPFEILDNIITINDTEKAWGVFENRVAKFYKRAIKGTEYHEVFEGVWKSFLSPEQQSDLLNEFKDKEGTFTDRETGRQIEYSRATDNQAKERIADDFADFRMGKISAKTLGEKIARFFKSIIEFFKSFVTKPSLKEELFKAIDTGKFKDQIIPVEVISEIPEYRKITGLTESQVFELVQDMTVRAAQIIYGEDKKALYSPRMIEGKELYNRLSEVYSEALDREVFDGVFKRVKENIGTILNIKEEREDINSEGKSDKEYDRNPFETNWAVEAPNAIKFTLATTSERQPLDQRESTSLEAPTLKLSEGVKGFILNPFNKMFATLINKLSNKTNITNINKTLLQIAKEDSNFISVFSRLGGNLSTREIDFTNFNYEDWRLYINFFQTFSKQKPEALIQYISGNEVYVQAADKFTAAEQLKRNWFENMKVLSKESSSIISFNRSTKEYNVKSSDKPIKTPLEKIEFLNSLGVDITLEFYSSLSTKDKDIFNDNIVKIKTYIGQNPSIGNISGKTLGISTPLNKLAELVINTTNPNQENTFYNVDGQKSQKFANNNSISIIENDFNSANTIDEIKNIRPELNDVFSTNSLILKRGGKFIDEEGNRTKELKVSYINGTSNQDTNKGVSTTRLNRGARFTQEINQNVLGNYYVLVPADSSTEWMMNLGNSIDFESVQSRNNWANTFSIFRGYLSDEIALALDWENRKQLKYVSKHAKQLRFFSHILSKDNVDKIHEMIENGNTQEQIEEYVANNTENINSAIQKYIETSVKKLDSNLKKTKEVKSSGENLFSYLGLVDEFANAQRVNKINKLALTEKDLNDVLTFVVTNYTINNIEYHKLLFGDPYQFKTGKNKIDATKRIKMFLSPRKVTFDTPEYNTFLNREFNNIDGVDLEDGEFGKHTFKSFANTVTLSDVELANQYFDNINEADAASFISLSAFREVQLKNEKWPNEAEEWYQWQMAYTRQNLLGYEYKTKGLEQHDKQLISYPEPQYTLNILKPIVSGVRNNEQHIILVGDKFSQMPLYYKAVQGTNLEKLYVKMFNENVDYVIFQSGRKFGITQMHSLYKEDGSFNNEKFNNNIEVPWSKYGILVETDYHEEKQQTMGSQTTKVCTMDLFDKGIGSPEATEYYKQYNESLTKLFDYKYKSLLNKLGIEDLGDRYSITDNIKISETLEYEMLRRALSENIKDTIQLDENGEFLIPFEASSAYVKIKDILYSMVHKHLISPKLNGRPHVQAPVTMWENNKEGRSIVLKETNEDGKISYRKISKQEYSQLSDERKANVKLADDTLKFYTEDAPYCEVMIPCWFKEKFNKTKFPTDQSIIDYLNNTPEGKRILTGIGFRIPTQAMSSIEIFRVKGFLDKSMGDTVIVPSAITAKAGSDFDIDKLNMYLKAVYTDKEGNIKLVEFRGSEEETKEYYRDVYRETVQSKLDHITSKDEYRQQLFTILDKFETIEGGIAKSIFPSLTNEETEFYLEHREVFENIREEAELEDMLPSEYMNREIELRNAQADSQFLKLINSEFADKYAERMYDKALQNDYFDKMEKLLSLPQNFKKLLTPVDDAGLEKKAKELRHLRGEAKEEENINSLLDKNYMTNLRHAFTIAKRWVGIAAVNITGHANAQKIDLHIDPERINALPKQDRDILKDGKVVLPHNVNDSGNISMSGVKTYDGKHYISDRLSGYATAVVDVAKDPYILEIIHSDLIVGTFMFLERIGAGENTIYFLNQPIIREYIEMLEADNYRNLFKKAYIKKIRNKFGSSIRKANIDVSKLKDNISIYAEQGTFKNSMDNAIQLAIFDEFLKYAKMAEFSFNLTQATNYDTTKFRSSDSFAKKNTKTELQQEQNIFSSVDKLLNATHIGKQTNLLSDAMVAMGAVVKTEQEQYKNIINAAMRQYQENKYLSADVFDRIAQKANASFLDFIILTRTTLGEEAKELLLGDNSIAKQLRKAKQDFPNIKILQDLDVTSSDLEGGAQSIKLRANTKEVHDENMYTDMMRELKALLPNLYEGIVKLSILQGTQQSAISIGNIIPVEDRAKYISDVMDKLQVDEQLSMFSKGNFQRTNWKNDDIVPTHIPKMTPQSEVPDVDQFGNEVYRYYSSEFPSIEGIGKSTDRRVLISDDYMITNKDFVKIPKIISVVNENGKSIQVNFATGSQILPSEFARRKAKGDQSLKGYYGYQKVKYGDGTDLLTEDGKYVYKLVNLWGDGQYATEHYTDNRPSIYNNGTIKIETEIPDRDLIKIYGISQDVVEQIEEQIEEKPVSLPEDKTDNWKEEDNNCIIPF